MPVSGNNYRDPEYGQMQNLGNRSCPDLVKSHCRVRFIYTKIPKDPTYTYQNKPHLM